MNDSSQGLTISKAILTFVICGAIVGGGIFFFVHPDGLFERNYLDGSMSVTDPQAHAQALRDKVELPKLEQTAVDAFHNLVPQNIERHLLNLSTPDRLTAVQWRAMLQAGADQPVLDACYELEHDGDQYVRLNNPRLKDLVGLSQMMQLTRAPFSRYTGYDGERAAKAYIHRCLSDLGLEVIEYPVDVPTPIDYGARLVVRSEAGTELVYPLQCMMPNGARTSSLPPDGISGELVDGGDGALSTLRYKAIEGRIVVVDLDSRTRWENVFRLGGRAVIFRGDKPANRDDTKLLHVFASANYPRFYASDVTSLDALYGQQVRLFSDMRWEKREAVSLIARVPGRDQGTGAIMITAHYDSSSVVPAHAPGADQACSAAFALELAGVLKRHPPRRDTLLAFFSGHHQALHSSRTLLDDWRCDSADIFPRLEDARRHRDHPLFKKDPRLTTALLLEHETSRQTFANAIEYLVGGKPIRLHTTSSDQRELLAQQTSLALARTVKERMAASTSSQTMLAGQRKAEQQLQAEDSQRFMDMNRFIINPSQKTRKELDLPSFMQLRLKKQIEHSLVEIDHTVGQLKRRRLAVEWLNGHKPSLVLALGLTSNGEGLNIQPHGYFMWATQPGGFHPDNPFWSTLGQAPMSWAALTEQIERGLSTAEQPRIFGTIYASRVSDGTPAGMVGYYATEAAAFNVWDFLAVNIGSTADFRLWHNTPFDTFTRVNTANLARQARYLAAALWKCAEEIELGTTQWELHSAFLHLSGHILTLDQRRGTVPNTPVPNAYVRLRRASRPLAGVLAAPIAMTDYRGRFEMPCILRQGRADLSNPEIAAFVADEAGNIVRAVDQAQSDVFPTALRGSRDLVEARFVAFECQAITIPDFTDPRFLVPLRKLFILAAAQEIAPAAWAVETSVLAGEEGGGSHWGRPWAVGREATVAVAFVTPDIRPKFLGAMSTLGVAMRFFLLGTEGGAAANDADIQVTGRGFDPDIGVLPFALSVAHGDLHEHVEKQHRLLASCNIRSDRLADMHRRSADHKQKAEVALQHHDYPAWLDHSLSGRSLALRAYMDAASTKGDTIIGVLFFMMIMLPFAFFTERLVFGFSKPVRQLVACVLIFMVSFFTLRLVHPGFEVAQSTMVVLLGFIIAVLSLFVIKLGFNKFEHLMRFVTVPEVAAHTMDISRMGAFASACFVSIGNMRRSRIRTALTLSTVTVMTFCVLSFTSVKTTFKPDSIPVAGHADYDGIMLTLNPTQSESGSANQWVFDQFTERFAPGQVSLRCGVRFNASWDDSGLGPPAPSGMTRLVGIMPEDAKRTGLNKTLARWKDPKTGQEKWLGRWLDENPQSEQWEVLLPLSSILPDRRHASRRTLSPEDFFDGKTHHVRIKGATFTAVGIFDDRAADKIHDANGEPCSPVLRRLSASRNVTTDTENPTTRMPVRVDHTGWKTVGLTNYRSALALDGGIEQIIIGRHPDNMDYDQKEDNYLEELADRITRETALDVYLAQAGNVSYWRAVPLTGPQGIGNIFLPLALGSLIIFNTLLASVQDRVSEIGIYNALGLAPPHIAAMFLAEAGVYAVMGSVCGYLSGQAVLSLLTSMDWMTGLSLNYSSTSALMTMGLMIVSIMLSALYPMHMVKKLCTAGAEASWDMPPAQSGLIHVDLPFTIDRDTAASVSRFIHEYVSGHREASLGTGFIAQDVRWSEDEGNQGTAVYQLSMTVRLAPYDMGIVQAVSLCFSYERELEMYTIYIRVHHRAGTEWLWYRKNKEFIDSIRRQLLLWHSLEPEVQARYGARQTNLS